jgi:hypothetical protein
MSYFFQINWVVVILGAIFNMVLGFIWYGPFFGKLWLKLIGKKTEEIDSKAGMYILTFIASLVGAYVLAVVIEGLAISLWWQGIVMGAVLWVGIGATATLNTNTFEDSPRGTWVLFALYQLIVFSAEGFVLAIWKL